jgi:aspartate aminotransferase-like enzyme
MVKPGDKVVVCQNGVFGGRMLENVVRCGARDTGRGQVGRARRPEQGRGSAREKPRARLVASCAEDVDRGSVRHEGIGGHCPRYDALTIVDAVTSLGGTPVLVDEWGVDAIIRPARVLSAPGCAGFLLRRVVDYVKRAGQDPFLVHGHEPAPELLGRSYADLPTTAPPTPYSRCTKRSC